MTDSKANKFYGLCITAWNCTPGYGWDQVFTIPGDEIEEVVKHYESLQEDIQIFGPYETEQEAQREAYPGNNYGEHDYGWACLPPVKEVIIPACAAHSGWKKISVKLAWVCPECGLPRGEPEKGNSYDGSIRMVVDTWVNDCGHIFKYSQLRQEAKENGLNGVLH